MKPITLSLALAFAGLFACSSGADLSPSPPVNEFLVVGNDKGFRDDYINQANLVTLNDSSLSVRSLRSADNVREYPLRNGYLEGGSDPALHWRFDTIGRDTITLTDTSRTSTFYLHRLRRVDSLPGALPLLTSGELNTGSIAPADFRQVSNYVFNDMGQGAGCMINRSYYGVRDWTKMVGNSDRTAMPEIEYYVPTGARSSVWRLYKRFAQPILVYDNYLSGLTVMPLDSLSANRDTLYGRSLSDRSFKLRPGRKLVRQGSGVERVSAEILAELPDKPDRVEVMPNKVRLQNRRRWEKAEGITEELILFEEDLAGLSLQFTGKDQLSFGNDDKVLVSTTYRFHDSAPYLVVGDECETNAYWHYELRGDSITFLVPVRVEVIRENEKPQVMDINGKEQVIPVGRWYFDEEWRATYFVGDALSK